MPAIKLGGERFDQSIGWNQIQIKRTSEGRGERRRTSNRAAAARRNGVQLESVFQTPAKPPLQNQSHSDALRYIAACQQFRHPASQLCALCVISSLIPLMPLAAYKPSSTNRMPTNSSAAFEE
jgi:hypothetical protein